MEERKSRDPVKNHNLQAATYRASKNVCTPIVPTHDDPNGAKN